MYTFLFTTGAISISLLLFRFIDMIICEAAELVKRFIGK